VIERPPDLDVARREGPPGAILAVEGGDFLEGRIERVQQAYDRGIRCHEEIELDVHFGLDVYVVHTECFSAWQREVG